MKKQFIQFGLLAAVLVVTAVVVNFASAAKPGGGGGGGNTPPPVNYVAGYTALIDGEGIYPGGNARPSSYDAIAPTVPSPAKVNVLGASTAQIFYNALVQEDTSGTIWRDCAYGLKTADIWANPSAREWKSCDSNAPSPDVVIIKTGHGSNTATVQDDITALQAMVTNAFNKWPSLKQVYLVDEGWLGYYQGSEPNGYNHGTAIKSVIATRVAQNQKFVAWGTYLWANGLGSDQVVGGIPGRNDELEWVLSDYASDGLHQSAQGAIKQAHLFMDSLRADPVASLWYGTN